MTEPFPTEHPENEAFHAREIEEVLDRLDAPRESGLTAEEARRRLEQYGPNQLTEAPPTSVWHMIWEQFNNFVVWLLLVAVIISAFLGDWAEAIAILLIVFLNALLGVIQERRAEQALAALKQLASPEATVIRDRHRIHVRARELVPGDIVLLEAGNYVPADVRLIESVNLRVEEAALTGESVPVEKDASSRLEADIPLGDRKNTAFMGTLVSYGRGRGVVASTGMRTQIGMIAEMLQSVHQEPTPLQKRLDQLGRTLGYAALALCGLVFVLGWVRGNDPLEMFLVAVSLAIAAVPEGLPAIVTISLALGMREMIRRNALIRRLSSVETLGSATVIGSDKTGTLTQNEMTATHLWADDAVYEISGSGYLPRGEFRREGQVVDLRQYPAALTSLWIGALNNDASLEESGTSEQEDTYRVVGDPTEAALLVAAAKSEALLPSINGAFPRLHEVPFDSERKRMVTVHATNGSDPPFSIGRARPDQVVLVKGAPDVILDLCRYRLCSDGREEILDEAARMRIQIANDRMTQDALRVLAVAYRSAEATADELDSELVFAGLIGLIDPPRPEVKAALEVARVAGIRTVMITGDYPKTARAIAESIGLLNPGQQVLTGSELNEMDDDELVRQSRHTGVYARVSPAHKVRIVQALRADGQVVAMTGDGVNDAPALKRSDIGVAMGITGTDVAKETADMVLTDDNYASIVSAVEQGRVIYGNIRKFVYYLLSCNLAEIAIITIATLLGTPRPLEAIQLLWLNLVTDGAPALALGVEKGDPDTMDVPPRPPDEPIINRPLRIGIISQTVSLTVVTLAAFLWGLSAHPENHHIAQTLAFVTLSASELPLAFIVRSERYALIKMGIFSNRIMNISVVVSFFLLLAVVYIPFLQPIFSTYPLVWSQWQVILPLIFVPALVAEVVKMLTARSWGLGR